MTAPAEPPPAALNGRFAIPFEIPAYWTPEQALAVIDLLDDLRERIWAHYNIRLFDLIQAEHHQRGGGDHD